MEDNMKTNSKNISKIVASALPAICLSSYNTLDTHAGELLRSIQNEQLKLPNATQAQVMQNVFKDYDNLNIEVKDTLDILWHNDAGNLLLRKLNQYIKNDTQKINIRWNAYDAKNETNLFRPAISTIFLNENELEYYAMYHSGKVRAFSERLDSVLFHELCHAWHNLDGTVACEQQRFVPAFYKLSNNDELCQIAYENWTDDEEIYTITGWRVDSRGSIKFDWLNANSYMILDALKHGIASNDIAQRIFHCGYWDISPKRRETMEKYAGELVIPLQKYIDE